MMQIQNVKPDKLAKVIAGLVKEGLTFEAYPAPDGETWVIDLLGGY